MDLSGSQIWIVDCTVKNAGDKGLSLGEQSTVGVHKLSISNSFMGIASKDKSEVKVTESEVSGCKVALTAYQKKAEFGPASLEFQGQLSDNETDHLIERGSKLNLNGEHIVGN